MKEYNLDLDIQAGEQADEVIDLLIEKVTAAYPPERLRRIEARSEATWKNTRSYTDRISYVGVSYAVPSDPQIPEDASDVQRDMIEQLKFMLYNAAVDDEFYPAFSSGLEQVTIPSMFGCVKEIISGSDYVKPIINSPDDVYSLPEIDIRKGYICHDILSRMAYKYRRAGGRIPLYMTDIQGPFSCAAQMWGIQDFLCDLEEYPNQAHHLLSLCTDAIIQYFDAMYDVTEGNLVPIHCMPYIWVPKDCGVAVSDDFMAIVGAETVRDYSAPYMDIIGERFGGITTHSCGNINHVASVLNEMKTIKALNFSATETDLTKYANENDPKIMLIVHAGGLSIGGLPLLNVEELIQHCAYTHKTTDSSVFALSLWTDKPADEVNCKLWEDAARIIG